VQYRNEKGQFVKGQKNETVVGRNELGRFVNKPVQIIVLPVENTKQTNVESEKKMFETKNSRANAIEAALMTGAETINDITNMVVETRPNDDPKKVKNQVKAILRDIREKRGRWAKYNIAEEGTKIVLR
jgi:hypothetical protein